MNYFQCERDVITLISGLLCIISLLPIIPTSISAFLPDLFEIFNYVTSQCHDNGLTECQITYLQYGLYMLFNRLYGMYPCNFMDFIRNEYAKREKKDPIYNHTIRNLLDTVKIHPNLITSTKSAELNPHHWKKMEPHDVVVECAKYSIDSEKSSSNFLDYPSPVKPLEYTTSLMGDLTQIPAHNYLASAKSVENRFESLWSPSLIIQATPPPTANLPNTPTPTPIPNYNLTSANSFQPMVDSSPPQLIEAAIEATPETTPNKPELRNAFRTYPNNNNSNNNSNARNIWPKATFSTQPANVIARNSSMPSSPLKKTSSDSTMLHREHHPQYPNLDLASNKKLMRIMSDRHEQGSSSVSGGDVVNVSREDQEVNDINSFNASASVSTDIQDPFATKPMEYEEESTSSDGTDENDDNDVTPPLYDRSLYQRVDYVRRVKRLRMYSHCIFSAGTSPADSVNYMPRIPKSNRLKRYNSWPNLRTADTIINSSKMEKKNESEHQQSSSVGSSSNEAVSAVSHFIEKKPAQNGANGANIFKQIKEDLITKPLEVVQKMSSSTQTVEYWPSAYEAMFYTIFGEEMRRKHEETTTILSTTTTTTTVTKSCDTTNSNLSPNEMIDKYIQTSLKRKSSNDYRDHIELLSIQLQFEKHRREIHAERNRRLLGKSRQIKGLEQSNSTLQNQVQGLAAEIQSLNRASAENRSHHQMQIKSLDERSNFYAKKLAEEVEKNKQLQREKDLLQMKLDEESHLRKKALCKNDLLFAENFDLKNLYEGANVEAERGKMYREQLKKLESELIIFNEARLKCQQQMEELEGKRAGNIELEYIVQSYSQEIQDTKRMLEIKTSQIDGYKARLGDYEQQIQKKDVSITDQKRLLKSIKDAHEEKFKVNFINCYIINLSSFN